MALSKSLLGVSYNVPEDDEKKWGSALTNLLASLADNLDKLYKSDGSAVTLPVPTSAPADGDLDNGEAAFWVDEGTNTLKVKVKKSGGTVVNGDVASLA